jgi:ABC-2 type transport system ATP-binding protein
MITITNLQKAFDEQPVLDGVDLHVEPGTVFALLGPNGSGKTTTVRILATLLKADHGTATIAGHDVTEHPEKVRRLIGVTGQFSAIDGLLTGRENLKLMADLHHTGHDKVDELLDRFELQDAADKPATTYSGGMKRRLDLAMTLTGSPRVIFLDEPTTGLDPRSRKTMWEVIRTLAHEGVTIFLTTQYLDEADELADHVAVLDHGRIVTSGTPRELKHRLNTGHIVLRFNDYADFAQAQQLLDAHTQDEENLTLQIPSDGTVPTLRRLLTQLDEHAIELADLSIETPDLDDVFFAVT